MMDTLKPSLDVASRAPSDPLRAFVRAPFESSTWRANLAILLGFAIAVTAASVLSTAFSVGGSLLVMLIGVPLIALGIELSRLFARIERWRMTLVDRRVLRPHAYRQFDGHPRPPYGLWLRQWAEAEFADESRWRDVAYVVILLPLASLEFAVAVAFWGAAIGLLLAPVVLGVSGVHIGRPLLDLVALVLGLVLLPVASWVSRGAMILHRVVVQGLLCVSESAELRQRVESLQDSRSAALEVEASELRRIERDLHDGAQQRLVMLAIDLTLAADRIDHDPSAAKALVADAREQARQALAELRDLVRGAAPAILLDRGLVAALGAVAGRCPVPTVVDSTLADGQRLPHAAERTAYFVVAEALTNVAKHSAATHCEVRCRLERDRLIVEVQDDGKGGAAPAPGGGLAGLRDRVQALDGVLTISSPAGGPTVLHAELPALAV